MQSIGQITDEFEYENFQIWISISLNAFVQTLNFVILWFEIGLYMVLV
jgi:hypothetical protein